MDKHTFAYEHNDSAVCWDVRYIWDAVKGLPVEQVPITYLTAKVGDGFKTYDDDDHQRVKDADLSYPIIVSRPKGIKDLTDMLIVDGYHRLKKHLELGHDTVPIQAINVMPDPLYCIGKPFQIKGLNFVWIPTKLYHYADRPFSALRSRDSQGIGAKSSDPWHYDKSISFFFDPIPLDIAKILHGKHAFWKSGVTLYEHRIDSTQIPLNVLYHIVETAERTKMLYLEQDWSKVTKENKLADIYKAEILAMEINKGYRGQGRMQMFDAAAQCFGKLRDYYFDLYELSENNPEDKLMEKYAATVPHVMLYLNQTKLPVHEMKRIKLK